MTVWVIAPTSFLTAGLAGTRQCEPELVVPAFVDASGYSLGSRVSEIELMQYRWSVGVS
jgi:hypothetical protein